MIPGTGGNTIRGLHVVFLIPRKGGGVWKQPLLLSLSAGIILRMDYARLQFVILQDISPTDTDKDG